MKTLSLTFFAFLITSLLTAQTTTTEAPPLEEIAANYIEAIGGSDAWKALNAMQLEGKVAMQGMEFPMTVKSAEGDKFRMDMEIQGSPMTQGFDGETAWVLFPLQGITEPKAMTEEESADMKQNPFLDVFIDSEARGYQMEAVEGKEVEGTPTYGVKVTHEDGFERIYYFDTENMVPIMQSFVSQGGQTKGMTMETLLSDYQEVEGLIIPMFMEQRVNGQSAMKMTFTDVTLNPELEEGLFSIPE